MGTHSLVRTVAGIVVGIAFTACTQAPSQPSDSTPKGPTSIEPPSLEVLSRPLTADIFLTPEPFVLRLTDNAGVTRLIMDWGSRAFRTARFDTIAFGFAPREIRLPVRPPSFRSLGVDTITFDLEDIEGGRRRTTFHISVLDPPPSVRVIRAGDVSILTHLHTPDTVRVNHAFTFYYEYEDVGGFHPTKPIQIEWSDGTQSSFDYGCCTIGARADRHVYDQTGSFTPTVSITDRSDQVTSVVHVLEVIP